jgi:hypothetical protein
LLDELAAGVCEAQDVEVGVLEDVPDGVEAVDLGDELVDISTGV